MGNCVSEKPSTKSTNQTKPSANKPSNVQPVTSQNVSIPPVQQVSHISAGNPPTVQVNSYIDRNSASIPNPLPISVQNSSRIGGSQLGNSLNDSIPGIRQSEKVVDSRLPPSYYNPAPLPPIITYDQAPSPHIQQKEPNPEISFDWAKNICDEDYSTANYEPIAVPALFVQIR